MEPVLECYCVWWQLLTDANAAYVSQGHSGGHEAFSAAFCRRCGRDAAVLKLPPKSWHQRSSSACKKWQAQVCELHKLEVDFDLAVRTFIQCNASVS